MAHLAGALEHASGEPSAGAPRAFAIRRNRTIVFCMPMTVLAAVLLVVPGVAVFAIQRGDPPAKPGELSAPAWRGVLTLSDGRRFVTDGGLAVDIALVMPGTVPTTDLSASAKVIEGYMAGPYTSEFGPGDVRIGPRTGTFVGPVGILMNATYINFLRNAVPAARLRFAVKGPRDPIVILVGGMPAGLLMPVAGG